MPGLLPNLVLLSVFSLPFTPYSGKIDAQPPGEKWMESRHHRMLAEPEPVYGNKQNTSTNNPALIDVTGTLEPGDNALDDASLFDAYAFEGEAGQIVSVVLESTDFDAYLLLIGADGKPLAENDDMGSANTNSSLSVTLPVDGTYEVIANAYDSTGRGRYQLTVRVMDAPQNAALIDQGRAQLQSGLPQEANASFLEAVSMAQALSDRPGEALALDYLAGTYVTLNQISEAIQAWEQSVVIYEELENFPDAARSLINISRLNLRYTDQTTETVTLLEQAVAYAGRGGDRSTLTEAQTLLGHLNFALDNYGGAIEAFDPVVAVILGKIQSGTFTPDDVEIVRKLAASYYFTGQCAPSQGLYDLALDMAKQLNDTMQTMAALQGEGNAAYCQGKFDEAAGFYEQALTIAESINDPNSEAQLLGNLGLIYVHQEQYDKAIAYLQRDIALSRQLNDRGREGEAIAILGDAYYWQGKYNEALDHYSESVAIAREVGYQRGVALTLTKIGDCLYRLNRLPEAEQTLREAVQVNQALRGTIGGSDRTQISTFDRQVLTYEVLQLVLVDQGKEELALEVAEAGRAEAFAQALASGGVSETALQTDDSLSPPTLSELKALAASQNATLVEYSIIHERNSLNRPEEKELFIWVIQPSGDITFHQVSLEGLGTSLEQTLQGMRNTLGIRSRGGFEAIGPTPDSAEDGLKTLYNLLIQPIAEELPSDPTQHVIFVPQGNLFLVPFPALINPEGDYLIQQHTLRTAPALRVLALTEQQAQPIQMTDATALIVGNPVMPEVPSLDPEATTTALTNLPGAEREALTIAELLGTTALIGSSATEDGLKQQMPQADIIHLATHGLLDYGQDLREIPGAIALTAGSGEDGLLTSEEIRDLSLNANLIVLSACDTGLGDIRGDGIVGLSRSFFIAGTPSVVVSLWSVPDAPTAELMSDFYRQLQTQPDKAQALRQAMLITIERNPNPRDWAAFTLMGEAL